LENPDDWVIRPVAPGDLGSGIAGAVGSGVHLYVFIARQGETATERPKPIQTLYAARSAVERPKRTPRWFFPYSVSRGIRRELPLRARVDLSGWSHESGHCWTSHLPQHAETADNHMHPTRSSLILLEDGGPLGPPHSAHQTIREVGLGAFSHWGEALYLSASDNSQPNANGRQYTALIVDFTPLPFQRKTSAA
jgi:hypothetical protein